MSLPLPETVQTAAAPVPVTLESPAAPGSPMSSWTHGAGVVGAPGTGAAAAWAGRGALAMKANAPAASPRHCFCLLWSRLSWGKDRKRPWGLATGFGGPAGFSRLSKRQTGRLRPGIRRTGSRRPSTIGHPAALAPQAVNDLPVLG